MKRDGVFTTISTGAFTGKAVQLHTRKKHNSTCVSTAAGTELQAYEKRWCFTTISAGAFAGKAVQLNTRKNA